MTQMIALESVEPLRDWFNNSAGKWRLIALVSST